VFPISRLQGLKQHINSPDTELYTGNQGSALGRARMSQGRHDDTHQPLRMMVAIIFNIKHTIYSEEVLHPNMDCLLSFTVFSVSPYSHL
jgi:hypothetical protein